MKHLQCRQNIRVLWVVIYGLSWIVLPFLLMATSVNANSQTVHALLVLMDADPNLGTVMKANQKNVESLLTLIEHEADLRLKKRLLLSSHNEVRKSSIMTWLEEINPSDGDVVFVYFSGFGGVTPQTDAEPDAFVYLQDGKFHQSDFAQNLQEVSNCRLRILITDRCKGFLKSIPMNSPNETPTFDKHTKIKHLFMGHEGFLHLSGAAVGEYGWADERVGGLFTDTLLHAINHPSGSDIDGNADGFIAWQEIFDLTQRMTADRFQSAYPLLSGSLKELLQEQDSASQTPTAYVLPNPSEPSAPGIESSLWTFTNPEHNFAVFLNTDGSDYQLNDYLTLRVLVTDDAHIIILNWDNAGKLTVLFPNAYQQNNFIEAGIKYAFPDSQSDFDFLLSGPQGTEQFKVIAIRHADDSKAITDLFPVEDSDFQSVPNHQRSEIEEKIMTYLRQMKPTDWTVASQTLEVREAKLPDPPNFGTPIVIPPDYGKEDTVYIKDGSYMYFAEVTDEVDENSETVAVDIFNKTLRKKLGDTVPIELVLGRRVEPDGGWGTRLVMLSFYRDGNWTFTVDAVVFDDYFLLPEIVDEKPIQGSREVQLSNVRIPIPVHFPLNE